MERIARNKDDKGGGTEMAGMNKWVGKVVEEKEKEPQNFMLLEEISKRGRMGLGGLGKPNKG